MLSILVTYPVDIDHLLVRHRTQTGK